MGQTLVTDARQTRLRLGQQLIELMRTRVMIVEDDLNIALLIQYNLEAAGFEVEHVERGDVAEHNIIRNAPDLLLVDWLLPGLSGIELCRRVRRLKPAPSLPIIMVTARAGRADRDFAIYNGANDVVTKPFVVSDLVSRARALLPPVPAVV